jgi:hypothetical protein
VPNALLNLLEVLMSSSDDKDKLEWEMTKKRVEELLKKNMTDFSAAKRPLNFGEPVDWRIQVASSGPDESLTGEIILTPIDPSAMGVQFLEVLVNKEGKRVVHISDRAGELQWEMPYDDLFRSLLDINQEFGWKIEQESD